MIAGVAAWTGSDDSIPQRDPNPVTHVIHVEK